MKQIDIIGLGAGQLEQMPLGVYRQLTTAKHVYLRTEQHPVVPQLVAEGLTYTSFDDVYEKHDDFPAVYEEIVATLLRLAEEEAVIYAVPGHPLVAERTVQLLIESGAPIRIGGGQSFLDDMFAALRVDPCDGFQLLDGTALQRDDIQLTQHVIIAQVYDAFIASEVKLTLMEHLPDDYEVVLVTAAGSDAEKIVRVPLYELDHVAELDNLTSLYVPPVQEATLLYRQFSKLRQVIAELRGPNGCPWDKKQTNQSLKKYLLEETYELFEAIENDDIDNMMEELGDVLLQVMLHAQIAEDDGMFTVQDVIATLNDKMVRRHPHVFGDVVAETAEDVLVNWNDIKAQEKEKTASLLDNVPTSVPNLMRAYDYQKQAGKVGFDWKEVGPMLAKIREELTEMEAEINAGREGEIAAELGDLLFAVVNVARYYNIQPEEALALTNEKFKRRFQYIEQQVAARGQEMEALTLDELDAIWNEAKHNGL